MTKRRVYKVRAYYGTVEIDEEICSGCQTCLDVCPMDVFAPNPEEGKPPVVLYPDECQFCGQCVEDCPLGEAGAIRLRIPLPMRLSVRRVKET